MKRLEREDVDVSDGHRSGASVDGSQETDYVVVASTRFDAKVDAASDSGLEIDQVRLTDAWLAGAPSAR